MSAMMSSPDLPSHQVLSWHYTIWVPKMSNKWNAVHTFHHDKQKALTSLDLTIQNSMRKVRSVSLYSLTNYALKWREFFYLVPCGKAWQDGREAQALTYKLSSLGLNPDSAINCHPGVSQAGRFINVCVVSQMDIKPGILSAGTSYFVLFHISWCLYWSWGKKIKLWGWINMAEQETMMLTYITPCLCFLPTWVLVIDVFLAYPCSYNVIAIDVFSAYPCSYNVIAIDVS